MTVPVDCSCGRRMMVRDDAVGKKARCPKCGAVVPVPEPVLEAELVQDEDDGLRIIEDEPAPAAAPARRGRRGGGGRSRGGFMPGRQLGSTKNLLPRGHSRHHAPIRGAGGRGGLPAFELFIAMGVMVLNIVFWILVLGGAFETAKGSPLGIWVVIISIPTVVIPGFAVIGLWLRADWGWGLAILCHGIGGIVNLWIASEFQPVALEEGVPNIWIAAVVKSFLIVALLISCKVRGAYN